MYLGCKLSEEDIAVCQDGISHQVCHRDDGLISWFSLGHGDLLHPPMEQGV